MTECFYFGTTDYCVLHQRTEEENNRVGVTAGRLGAGCTGPRAAVRGLNAEGGLLWGEYGATSHVLISSEDLTMTHLGTALFYLMNWKLLCLH